VGLREKYDVRVMGHGYPGFWGPRRFRWAWGWPNDVDVWKIPSSDSTLIVDIIDGQTNQLQLVIFIEDPAGRIRGRVQIAADAYRVYANAILDAFGLDCDIAVLNKIYGKPLKRVCRDLCEAPRVLAPSARAFLKNVFVSAASP
jgi:hypothetical protein